MNRFLFRSLVIAFCLNFALSLTAWTQTSPERSVRIGIYAPDGPELSAVLTAELGKKADIELVEREALAQIGDEAKIQRLASNDPVALGKLLKADGLLFIEKSKEGIQARLTSVSLGYVLFNDQLESHVTLAEAAKIIEHKVVAYRSKMILRSDQAIPVSVLNLRGEVSSWEMTQLERKLSLLLESRLASLPGCVVLERRHAWSMGFERSLDATPDPLLLGAYRIDGSMSISSQNSGNLLLKLRIRRPNGSSSSEVITGSITDLPGLVEKIVAEFGKRSGTAALSAAPEAISGEAREYLEEGIWAWRNGQPAAALEAVDSAELLGEKASDLLLVRLRVLCELGGGVADLYNFADIQPTRLDERVDQMLRAMQDAIQYRKEGGVRRLQILEQARIDRFAPATVSNDYRPEILEFHIYFASSKLLVALNRSRHPRLEELRTAVRSLAGYDPLHQQISNAGIYALRYADVWSRSPDEILAYFHLICSKRYNDSEGQELNEKLFRDGPAKFCAQMFQNAPEQIALFWKFVDQLTDDPSTKPLGLALRAKWASPDEKGPAYFAFLRELSNCREALMQTRQLASYLRRAVQLRMPAKADPELVALIRFYLQNENKASPDNLVWSPSIFPPNDAPLLWKDLQDSKKRSLSRHPEGFRPGIMSYYSDLENKYTKCFGIPETSSAQSVRAPLELTRFWNASAAARGENMTIERVCGARGGAGSLWVYGQASFADDNSMDAAARAALFKVSLPELKTECKVLPWKVYPHRWRFPNIQSDGNSVFLVSNRSDANEKNHLIRYQASSQTWSKHEISDDISRLFFAGGRIYFSLLRDGGLCRHDWDNNQTLLLASSRRRPAQNQFDDRSAFTVANVFEASDNSVCAEIESRNYVIQETPGNWKPGPKYDSFPGIPKDKKAGVFLGEALYGSCPEPQYHPMSKEGIWFQRGLSIARAGGDEKGYGFRGNEIFLLTRKETFTLWWFKPENTEPIPIPLEFKLDASTQAELRSTFRPDIFESIAGPSNRHRDLEEMVVADEGICFFAPFGGFWFLPFSDIDAYLRSVQDPSTK